MKATLVFVTQVALSLLSCGLIARWVVYPRLRDRSLRDALTPLLLFQTFRTLGLIFLVPGLVDAALPAAFAIPGVVGDMLAVALAFAALAAVRAGWRTASALIWLLTVEGLADFITAFAQGLRFNIAANDQLGIGWLIPTYAVPAFVAGQVTVIALLRNRERQGKGEGAGNEVVRVQSRLSGAN